MSESERTPYPKYQECPCGSGQKYKFCCFMKGFHYYLDDDRGLVKDIPMSKEVSDLLKQRCADLEQKLGRPLKPDDRLFPELADLNDEEAKQMMIDTMQKVGTRPVLIYAFEKTGLMVTDSNKHLIADVDLAAWDVAVEEYYALHPEDDPRTT